MIRTWKKKIAMLLACIMVFLMAGCAFAQAAGEQETNASGLNYMVLVNRLHPLPQGWEGALETVSVTNSLGDDVEVEKKACEAYVRLKEDLLANDGIEIDLDSARRSVAEQQRIMDDFTEKYGADYAEKTVAVPGYSEHHTGLALDLYLRIDGRDVCLNEEMMQYPQIWSVIHGKLAQYGFILRYPEGKEHITGYGYEPWHIRYIDDPAAAAQIMSGGITLEGYLGVLRETDVWIDFGNSALFSKEELEEAAVQVKCRFATFEGCELHNLRYAGDESNNEEALNWLNGLDEGADYIQAIQFLSDFHSPQYAFGAWQPDEEYVNYQWWLARSADSGWQLVSWGY